MKHEIKICMGSSCFARGNDKNLDYIENFVQINNLDAEIEIAGERCKNLCASGPNILIDGKNYQEVNIEKIKTIMNGLKNE